MGRKCDFTRWLQNKKHRTPLEDRVLAASNKQALKYGAKKTPLTAIQQDLSDSVSRSRSRSVIDTETLEASSSLTGESGGPASELVSVLDEYLKQRRIRLLDLFRCVDVLRTGSCSRQDFCYVLNEAGFPATQAQLEQFADSIVDGRQPGYVNYSQLVITMNRHSEMRLFRKRRGDVLMQSSSTVELSRASSSLMNGVVLSPLCPQESETSKEPSCEDKERSYCRRVIKLFRDNALFADDDNRSTSSLATDDVTSMKSTLGDDDGLATRLQQLRLHDRLEYEALRDMVRRHKLPVSGRALRRGLLTATDRPRSHIDVRRLPSEHMLTNYKHRYSQTQSRTDFEHADSLDGDERRRDASMSTSAGRPGPEATNSQHSASSTRRRSGSGSRRGVDRGVKISEELDSEEKDSDGALVGERRRVTRRATRPRLSEEQQSARKYWTGRADHVRLCRTEGERGGHPIFQRVDQTWYNDDPRYLVNRADDEAIGRFCCRISSMQLQQPPPHWSWQRTIDYTAVGPLAVYRCLPDNDSTDQ